MAAKAASSECSEDEARWRSPSGTSDTGELRVSASRSWRRVLRSGPVKSRGQISNTTGKATASNGQIEKPASRRRRSAGIPRSEAVPTAPAPPTWNGDFGRIPRTGAIERSVSLKWAGRTGRRRPGRPQKRRRALAQPPLSLLLDEAPQRKGVLEAPLGEEPAREREGKVEADRELTPGPLGGTDEDGDGLLRGEARHDVEEPTGLGPCEGETTPRAGIAGPVDGDRLHPFMQPPRLGLGNATVAASSRARLSRRLVTRSGAPLS